MKILILADGEGKRWGNYKGVPKHLLEIDGERLIDRMIRQCPGDCDLCEENNEDEDTDDSLGDGDWTRVGVPTVDYGVHHD